ncbi:MAG: alpha/beta hydrolase [Calothrix sp. C42_A2020_038]|nr:alpha/beta hydrolase [Calothrix sp. C42_A2020_038]
METLFRNSRRKLSQGLLFWREVGQGANIVFLHGTWNDGSQWVPTMESLSHEYHCFAPDLLGFGESEIPDIHYSIDLQVESLAEFLTALKLERVYLVAHSLGAWVAASYALKYPERVLGLILVSPEGVATEGTNKRLKRMQSILQRSELIFTLLRLIRPIAKMFGWEIKVKEEWRQRLIMEQYPTACELLFERKLPEIYAEFLENRLAFLVAPVLILQGSKDTQDVINISKTYAQLIPGASLKMIAHGDHDLPQLCTSFVAEEIRDFIKSRKTSWAVFN